MKDFAFTFDDVLLTPTYNNYESRRSVEISQTDKTQKLTLQIPLISANMDSITEHKMANFMTSFGAAGALHRFMSIDRNVAEFKLSPTSTFVSLGVGETEFRRAEALRDAGANYFIIDVAHAHAGYVGRALKRFREMLPNACLMAGNVATYAGAEFLAACGVDLIKVGIGGGSVCTTRVKTGFGVPTLFSIQDCVRIDRSVVADGGLRTPGDIVKALAFGADFVMIGGLLAGTSSTPGNVVKVGGQKYKQFRGMASREAQIDFVGKMQNWKTAEGVSVKVRYRDDEAEILQDIIGGLRSGLTYGGALNIRELQRKLSYSLISGAANLESQPHARSREFSGGV
jgi:IMP dehydrogenase